MTERPVLELNAVRKLYGRQAAVDGVSLALRPEEFMTFLGPSGSGKTTTLMMVAGLTRPDGGAIVLDGTPVDRLPPYRRDIGMVFQHYALFPHMTVSRNIAFPLEARRTPRAEIDRLVSDALHLVGLPDHGGRLPRELSGGQQQRVALARAMVYRPALLLMDEPLGALDRKLREQMQREIIRVHRERRMAVLYVTHDQEEALTMSDRIAVFNKGRIEQVGTPEELYERPATRFVAGFVGETNFLPGRFLGAGGGVSQVEVAGTTLAAAPAEAGRDVVLAIRPERIAVSSGGSGLPARLEDVTYLGNARRLGLRLADGCPCTAHLPIGQADTSGLAIGDLVCLAFRPEHARVFPA